MKAHKSPLVLNNFLLLNLNYSFLEPDRKKDINVSEIISAYNLDIDFAIPKAENNIHQLFTKIEVNSIDKPTPGYVLSIEGVCIFSFDKAVDLSKEEKSNLLHFSGLNISINSLRNILATVTSNGPFGRYMLPSIDVNMLLTDKHNSSKHPEVQG